MIVMPPVFNAGDTIYFYFDTYDSNGASVTITGLAVTDIEVYKNGSVTQRSSDSGYALLDTDGIDFDATTGLHGFSIDTSDNTDAGFWADGAQYLVNVNAITVDSQTVRFSYLLPLGFLLRPTTAGRKLDVSSGGEAGLDWANIGSPTTTVDLSGTTVKTATDVAAYLDTEIAAILAAVDTEVASILADTGELQTDWTNGGRLDLIIDAILADTNELQTDWADGGRLDLILDARASQTSVDTVDDFVDTEVAAILAAVDTEIASIVSSLAALFTTALSESYRSAGSAPTVAQALFEIIAQLGDSSISGTTKTIRNLAGSAAKTYTLNSSSTPTSITETT